MVSAVRFRGFPHAGIEHRTVHLPSYRKMSVTTEEYELVLAYRKQKAEVRESMQAYLDNKRV